ncbi:3245_t:CDS:2, partial [Racocetra fulgida]
EWYLLQHPLLKNTRLKSQSRVKTTQLIRNELIKLYRVDGAVDFTEWMASGNQKSTNRIDDIVKLTDKGQEYVNQIQAGDGKTCQHQYGGIGECIPECSNFNLLNNLKNGNDMHCCSVRVHSFSRLSFLNSNHQLRIKIEGAHYPTNMVNVSVPQITRINLTCQVRDQIITNRRADHQTTKAIKGKLLYPLNGANEEDLNEALLNSREICDNK